VPPASVEPSLVRSHAPSVTPPVSIDALAVCPSGLSTTPPPSSTPWP
jgi:hypothetical protein